VQQLLVSRLIGKNEKAILSYESKIERIEYNIAIKSMLDQFQTQEIYVNKFKI
jgi:hypothetical protein